MHAMQHSVPMRATKLLNGFVSTPRQLKGEMTAAPLVADPLVSLQTDANRGSITDDGDVLPALHECFFLPHVDHLLRHSLLHSHHIATC